MSITIDVSVDRFSTWKLHRFKYGLRARLKDVKDRTTIDQNKPLLTLQEDKLKKNTYIVKKYVKQGNIIDFSNSSSANYKPSPDNEDSSTDN